MPLHHVPLVLASFATAQAQLMGADPAGIFMSALAVCAAAIDDEIQLQVKSHDLSWRESARLWVGLVGMPSTKKTPIMAAAVSPLRRLDKAMAERNEKALKAYQALPEEGAGPDAQAETALPDCRRRNDRGPSRRRTCRTACFRCRTNCPAGSAL